MKITPTTLTLQQFFSVGNEQFLIPAYQRRYAWGRASSANCSTTSDYCPPAMRICSAPYCCCRTHTLPA